MFFRLRPTPLRALYFAMLLSSAAIRLAAKPALLAGRSIVVGGDSLLVRRAPAVACVVGGEDLLTSPAVWATGILALLCSIFAVFEKSIETAKENVPRYVRPSIDAVLGEMATLGFIGLLVSYDTLGLRKGALAAVSERYLGESMLGFELFEALHDEIFLAAVAFFVASGVLIFSAVRDLETIFSKLDRDGDGLLTLDEFLEADIRTEAKDPVLLASLLATEEVPSEEAAEVQSKGGLTVEDIKELTSERLEEVVELSPLIIFLLLTPISIFTVAIELTAAQPLSASPGDYYPLLPIVLAINAVAVSMNYATFSQRGIALGEQFFGRGFVPSSIQALTFFPAYVAVAVAPLLLQDSALLLSGSAPFEVVAESAIFLVLYACIALQLVRLNTILFEYVAAGCLARFKVLGPVTIDA